MRLPVALALVWFPVAAAAALVGGPERAVSAPPVAVAGGWQTDAAVASNGSETLAAWADFTDGRNGIYVAALADDGTVLAGSQRWIAVARAEHVSLTWTGGTFLVLWNQDDGIAAAQIDRDRNVLTAPHVVLAEGRMGSNLRWSGSRGFFTYNRSGSTAAAAFIAAHGDVLQKDLPVGVTYLANALVETDGTSFYVFSRVAEPPQQSLMRESVYVTRFQADGSASAPMKLFTAGIIADAWDTAFDGHDIALVLVDRTGAGERLRRSIIAPATMSVVTMPELQVSALSGVRVVWTGSNFVAYWTSYDAARYFVRTLAFTSSQTFTETANRVTGGRGPATGAAGAWNGRTIVITWTDRSRFPDSSDPDIFGTATNGVGQALAGAAEPTPVAFSAAWQTRPVIRERLIAWFERSTIEYAPARLIAALDGRRIVLSESATPWKIVALSTGTAYIVMWAEGNNIVLRRIALDGSLLDPQPVVLGTGTVFTAAWNGRHILFARTDGDKFLASRLEPDGTAAGEAVTLAKTYINDLQAASNGTDFLVVWTEGSDYWQWPTPDLIDVRAIAVGANGSPLGSTIEVATGPTNQRAASVASDGRDYVVSYYVSEFDGASRVETRRVLREGVAAETSVIAPIEPFHFTTTAIAAAGDGYFVAWETLTDGPGSVIRAARLDRSGAPLEISSVLATSAYAGMVLGLWNTTLVYARILEDPVYGGAMRVFTQDLRVAPRRRSAPH